MGLQTEENDGRERIQCCFSSEMNTVLIEYVPRQGRWGIMGNIREYWGREVVVFSVFNAGECTA